MEFIHYHKYDITTSKDKSKREDGALRVNEFATKLRDVIELLILYRDLILLNFSLGTELIIIPLSIPAPNSDWIIFSSEGLSPYQTISSDAPSYGLARTSLKLITPLFRVLKRKYYH